MGQYNLDRQLSNSEKESPLREAGEIWEMARLVQQGQLTSDELMLLANDLSLKIKEKEKILQKLKVLRWVSVSLESFGLLTGFKISWGLAQLRSYMVWLQTSQKGLERSSQELEEHGSLLCREYLLLTDQLGEGTRSKRTPMDLIKNFYFWLDKSQKEIAQKERHLSSGARSVQDLKVNIRNRRQMLFHYWPRYHAPRIKVDKYDIQVRD